MIKNSKRAISFLMSMVMCLVMFNYIPQLASQVNIITADAAGINNITARADYLYNLTWTSQANMNGYINSSGTVTKTYTKGQSYRIPYGQPVGSNGFIGYNISVDNFIEATKSASNPFYTKRGGGTSGSMSSNYYSMDCSTFVSYCWGLSSRHTTSTWSSVNATNLGKCTSANVGKIQQGDAINLAGNHIVLVSRVNSNGTYEITEEAPPEIKRTTYSASDLVKKYSSYTIYRYNKRDSVAPPPNATPSSHSPNGVVDSASGGAGTVSVAGWGFDPDNTSAAIDVHVYLRDSSGNMLGVGAIKADQQREDVNNVYGCGNNHGYSATISTDYTGNYHVMVALIDSESDDPTWCDGGDITITSADKTKPVVSNATFSKITPTGFTVKCNATDDKKIKNVRVAIWINDVTEPIWHDCVSNGNDTYSFDFDISSYNNQKGPYNCHIYAWDESDNEGMAATETITINCDLGENFDAMIKNPNSGKYAITSVNNDNVMLYQFINSFGSKQVWNFSKNSDGSYRIKSYFNSKCLDVGGDENGKNIYTWTANSNATQKWYIVQIGENYKFFPACSNTRCMDINGGYTDNRTNIQLWDTNDSGAQKFTIDKISDTTAPVIKDVKISDITKDGYKVTVTVTDNIGVKIVKVPTWTQNNSQDDLVWHEAKQTSDNTWTYTVKVSDHKNEHGVYYTDVYADDFAGNQDVWHSTNNHRSTVKVGMYNLTLNPNGGTAVNESGTKTTSAFKMTKNQLIYLGPNYNDLSGAKPSRTGYTFTGWFTAATGGTKVHGADGKCVNDGAYFKNDKYQKAAALTLYAQWKANSYTVALNANGGECIIKNTIVTYDSKYGTIPTPTRKGYTFTGWYTATTGGTKVTADTKVAITANQTLYAQWKAMTVKGDVNNDGEFTVADVVLLQKWLLAVPDTKLENWKAADLCDDGVLDVFDLCLMKRMLVKS